MDVLLMLAAERAPIEDGMGTAPTKRRVLAAIRTR
jgi:hypothetical protein